MDWLKNFFRPYWENPFTLDDAEERVKSFHDVWKSIGLDTKVEFLEWGPHLEQSRAKERTNGEIDCHILRVVMKDFFLKGENAEARDFLYLVSWDSTHRVGENRWGANWIGIRWTPYSGQKIGQF